MTPKWHKNDTKMTQKFNGNQMKIKLKWHKNDTKNDTKMTQKMTQNYPKMFPKWLENDTKMTNENQMKMERKWHENDTKMIQNGPKFKCPNKPEIWHVHCTRISNSKLKLQFAAAAATICCWLMKVKPIENTINPVVLFIGVINERCVMRHREY